MINTQTLKGNLINQDYSTAFTLSQGDKGVPFRVELLENGTPYTLLDSDTVSIEWYKPNGSPFLQDTGITKGDTYIEITTPEAISQSSGSGTFNVIISDGTTRKGTIRREYKVIPTSMRPGSVSEDTITDAITELRNLNTELAEKVQNNQEIINSNSAATKQDIANVNSSLEEKANKDDVANISNGTPLFASSTTEMTDTTKNYVNLADGYLYIYNGTTFEKSDVLYQATGIADGSIDVKKFDSLLAEKFKSIIIESKETLSTYMINGVDTTSKNINENSITYTTNSSYGTFGWNVENKSNSKFIFINQLENLGSVDSNYKFMIGYKSDSFSGSIKLNGEEITSSSVINAGATINCNLVVEPGKTPDEYPVFGLCVFTTTNGATLKLTQKIYNVTNLSDDEINSINWDNPTSSIQLISDISKKAKSLDSIYEESLKSDIIKILPEPVQKIVIDTIGKEKLISPPSSENITTYMKNGVDVSTIQQTDNIIEFTTNTTYGTVGLCVSNAIDNKYVAVSTVSNLGEVESSISLLSAYGESSIGGSVSVNGDFYDTFNLGDRKSVV